MFCQNILFYCHCHGLKRADGKNINNENIQTFLTCKLIMTKLGTIHKNTRTSL